MLDFLYAEGCAAIVHGRVRCPAERIMGYNDDAPSDIDRRGCDGSSVSIPKKDATIGSSDIGLSTGICKEKASYASPIPSCSREGLSTFTAWGLPTSSSSVAVAGVEVCFCPVVGGLDVRTAGEAVLR